MFYGVINETCNKTDYLEMELKNSLLFFESLEVVQESGIQIVQESFSDIAGKIKELWEKFTKWVKSIWEKIKAIFTKKKDVVKEIKETNDKIQKIEAKEVKNESFSYIKEDSEEADSKEIKWYGCKSDSEITKIMNEYMGGLAEISLDAFLEKHGINDKTKVVPDSFIDDYCDLCKNAKEKLSNTEILNQLFIENTFTDINNFNQLKATADKITKDSESVDVNSKGTNYMIKTIEELIGEFENGIADLKKNNVGEDNMVTNYDGLKIPLNGFDRAVSNAVSYLHLCVSFLAKYESMCIKYLNSNKVAIKKLESHAA